MIHGAWSSKPRNSIRSMRRYKSQKALSTMSECDQLYISYLQSNLFVLVAPCSYCCVAPSTSATLYCIENPSHPVLEQIGDVSNGIAMWEKIPASSAVAIVVQPRAEDKVGRGGEEGTEMKVSGVRGVSLAENLHDNKPSEEAPSWFLLLWIRGIDSIFASVFRSPFQA